MINQLHNHSTKICLFIEKPFFIFTLNCDPFSSQTVFPIGRQSMEYLQFRIWSVNKVKDVYVQVKDIRGKSMKKR